MLGTAFFFSWEENWGTQRPFLASLTLPHALAALATSHQRALYFNRSLHKATSCAERCTTSCVQYSSPIPSSTAQRPIPFLQNSTYARALSNLSPTHPRCRPPVLPSFATCGSVHDRSCAWSALYLPGDRIGLAQVSFRVPRLRTDLATRPQLVSCIDRYPYRVSNCAKACTVTCARDCHFFPQQVELLSLSLLQNAALARGLSAFVTTCPRPRQLHLPSYAAREDMHNCSHAQLVLHLLRMETSTFSRFPSMPHKTAPLAKRGRRGPRPKCRPYQISWRAEARTTARTLIIFPIPFPVKQHVPTFPQSAASARAFSSFASLLPRPRLPLLQSYAARRDVHGCLWPLPVPQFLMEKDNSFHLFRALHAAADLATWHRRGPLLDRRLYQIAWRANVCLTARVDNHFLIPQIIELLIPTSFQNAAPMRGLSYLTPARRQYRQTLLRIVALRENVCDHLSSQSLSLPLRVEDSSLQGSLRAPQALAALAALPQHVPYPDSRLYQVVRGADTCTTACAQDWNLSPSGLEPLSQTSSDSAASVRGLSYSEPMCRQYGRVPLGIIALCGDMCGHSRQFAFTARKQALRFRAVLLAQLSSGSSLRLERTEDSPDLSWEEMMRCRRGSTCEYVQRDDFEPRARRSGALARQAGGAATRMAQPPQPHNPSNSQHTATAHPRRLLGSAPNSVEISSIGGTTGPQRIGALRFLDPQQLHKTFTSGFKAPTARAGIPASNKQLPKFSLVQASQPFKLERRPTSRAASPGPRAKYRDRATTADRLIGVP